MDRNDLFEKWLNSLDIPLTAWQKEVLRVACTQPNKRLYISMPKCHGRLLTLKLVEQYEQMIKGEKEMQKKLEKFNMTDIHSGYVVRFRNGKLALCMRVGEKFTKIFAMTSVAGPASEGSSFFYASSYKNNYYYTYDPVHNIPVADADHDIIEVYGLVDGKANYHTVGITCIANRPLIWSETKKMTLEDIEKALGFKVEIVGEKKEAPIKSAELCNKCIYNGWRCIDKDCNGCTMFDDNPVNPNTRPCKCLKIKNGEPCPYFTEVK